MKSVGCVKRKNAAVGFVVAMGLAANRYAHFAAAQPCPMQPGVSMPEKMPGAVPPRIPLATSVAAVDTSTSVVIRPDPADQITCRRDAIQTISDVVFATRALPDGKSMNLLLDVQIPVPRGKEHPLVIYVPGGGFMMAAKEQALNLRTYVADAGFVVASVQYRTMLDGATFRDGVADVKSAIRYFRANARKYDIDASKVAVWGESAGGYIVSMVGVTNGVKSFDVGSDLDQESDVQAVVDKFGPSDVAKIAADFDPQLQASYQANNPFIPYLEGKANPAANPLTYIEETAPPFLLFHGSRDRLISPSQTLLLHNALVAAGVRSTRYVLEGAGHGDLAFMGDFAAGLPWSARQTMSIIVDFLKATPGK
jgi:acetyl esterase/lipase